jgi:hypothetical protein
VAQTQRVLVALEAAALAVQEALVALVLLFFLFQPLDTQAQPQVHQQSPQAAQIQF